MFERVRASRQHCSHKIYIYIYILIKIASVNSQITSILIFHLFFFSFHPPFHIFISDRLFHMSYPPTLLKSFSVSYILARSAFNARRSGTDPRRARGPLRVLGRVITRRALSIRGEVTLERQRTSEQVCACVGRHTQAVITTGPPGRARAHAHAFMRPRLVPDRLPLPVTAGRPEFRGPLPDTSRGTGTVSFSAGNISRSQCTVSRRASYTRTEPVRPAPSRVSLREVEAVQMGPGLSEPRDIGEQWISQGG